MQQSVISAQGAGNQYERLLETGFTRYEYNHLEWETACYVASGGYSGFAKHLLMAGKLDKQDYRVGKCHCKVPVLALGFEGGKDERRGPLLFTNLHLSSSTLVPSSTC